ncbi:hypothetical protein [Aerolutibacter daejeonensis]|uniref:hypothetical protein n=1 Tax=Aerolutibacter daejeonensis TaxID=346181 RepID=UPI0006902CDC|nr:hypothetical protein [Lysobacter daejeonensis]
MRPFKPMLFALATAVAAFTGSATAQDYSLGWNPRSGDVWVDTYLDDVNRYGSRYRDPFVNEMVRYYGAPRDLVVDLLTTRNWAPGDVYYACSIAQVLGRPCRYVADYWDEHHGKGWGVVAQELGIKPGSAEFHRLKKGFVPTYDRWGRPISLSDDLRKDYPGRGKGPNGSHAPGHGAKGKAPAAAGKPAQAGGPGKAPGADNRPVQAKGPPAGKGPGNQGGRDDHGPGHGPGTSGKGGQGKGQGDDKGKGKGNGNG